MKKLSIFIILAILPFIVLAAFVNPLYDDYSYANNVLRVGFYDAQINLYHQWAGRYFSNILLSLNPIVWGNFTLYKIVPLFIIWLTYASIFCFIQTLLKKSLEMSIKLCGAGLLTVLFLNGMPDPLDGIYWIPGSLSYQFANILTFFLLALLMKAFENPPKPRISLIIVSYFLIVAIVGSSETSMVFLLFIISSLTAVSFIQTSPNRWIWLGLWALTILCSFLVMASPGNEIRSLAFANRHQFFYSVGMALAQEVRFIATWITNPGFILISIFTVPMAQKLIEENELQKKYFFLHPLISTALLLGLIFCGLFPPYWATGILGQHRSVNVAYFFFLIGWFLLLFNWVAYFNQKGVEMEFRLPKFVYAIGLPLLLISLLATNNSREAVIDLVSGQASTYNQEMRQRSFQLAQCAQLSENVCKINEIQTFPNLISRKSYFNPISFNYERNYWILKLKTNFN